MVKVQHVSAASSTDENGGEWLSTRNKKKISPPLLKMRGGNHLVRRPVPRSPLMLLMDEMPAALKITKKQTSIADFFSSHLKGLPVRDDGSQRQIPHSPAVGQEPTTSAHCGEDDRFSDDDMYVDFDMPGPTPAHCGQPAFKNPIDGDCNGSVPGLSQVTVTTSSVDDLHFARRGSSVCSTGKRLTARDCSSASSPGKRLTARGCSSASSPGKKLTARGCSSASSPGKRLTASGCSSASSPGKRLTARGCSSASSPGKRLTARGCSSTSSPGKRLTARGCSSASSPGKRLTARGCSSASFPGKRLTAQMGTTLHDQVNRGSLEGGERKLTRCKVTSAREDKSGERRDQTMGQGKETGSRGSDSKQGRVTSGTEQVDSVSRTKRGCSVAPLFEDRRRKQRNPSPERRRGGEEHASDTGLRKRNEKNDIHRCSSQPEGNSSDEDGLCDSLQTPPFLKEAHHTLDFSQPPAVARAASGAGSVKSRPKPTARGARTLTESGEILRPDGAFAGFTQAGSLHFTETCSLHFSDDDDWSQTTQQWGSTQLTSGPAVDRRRAEPKLSMSSARPASPGLDECVAGDRSGGSGCGRETFKDSLQTPEFLLSSCDEAGLGASWQQMGGWREEELDQEGAVTTGVGGGSLLCEDLHTPGFLKEPEDCSSVDSC